MDVACTLIGAHGFQILSMAHHVVVDLDGVQREWAKVVGRSAALWYAPVNRPSRTAARTMAMCLTPLKTASGSVFFASWMIARAKRWQLLWIAYYQADR